MTLEINGEIRSLPSIRNIEELLRHLGLSQDRIAVEVNRRLIRRGEWDSTPLNESDRVEIVQFVGGG
jgi:thiamine biosynthesis protein ThiS